MSEAPHDSASGGASEQPAGLAESLRHHLERRKTMGLRRLRRGAAAVLADPAEPGTRPAASSEPVSHKQVSSNQVSPKQASSPQAPPGAVASSQAATNPSRPTPTPPVPSPSSPQPAASGATPSPQASPPSPDSPHSSQGSPSPPTAPAPADSTPAALAPQCLDLKQLEQAVSGCRACQLCQSRTQTVFADGSAQPGGVFFIGEAPGAEEDRTGTPFVGPAGALLTDIIQKGMGLARSAVTIANVLKCRPPGNRDPLPLEKSLCTPFLDRQIELVDPKVLIPLGKHAAQHILGVETPISRLRGQVHEVRGRAVVPTFHPAYLLRNPAAKRECWADIQLAMRVAGIPLPPRG